MTDLPKPDQTLDCRGLSCPMPIVRTRKAMDALAIGDVLEVLVTDRGAPADFRGWCQQTDQKFLGAYQAGDHIRIYLKKVVPESKEKARLFEREMTNDELARRLSAGEPLVVLDVREPDEYAAGHIPGARHVPIEDLEAHLEGLDRDVPVAVVCRSGRRSGYACQILEREGFRQVWNVVPGMTAWTGPVEK